MPFSPSGLPSGPPHVQAALLRHAEAGGAAGGSGTGRRGRRPTDCGGGLTPVCRPLPTGAAAAMRRSILGCGCQHCTLSAPLYSSLLPPSSRSLYSCVSVHVPCLLLIASARKLTHCSKLTHCKSCIFFSASHVSGIGRDRRRGSKLGCLGAHSSGRQPSAPCPVTCMGPASRWATREMETRNQSDIAVWWGFGKAKPEERLHRML